MLCITQLDFSLILPKFSQKKGVKLCELYVLRIPIVCAYLQIPTPFTPQLVLVSTSEF